MAAGDKYLTAARRNLNKEQLFRLLCREDENGKPFLNVNAASGQVSVLQSWYDSLIVKPSEGLWTDLKIMADGMKSDGDWDEADFIGQFAGMETQEQQLTPLKTTSGSLITAGGLYTLNNNGFSGISSGYLTIGWNPFDDGIKFTTNDCFGMICNSSVGSESSGVYLSYNNLFHILKLNAGGTQIGFYVNGNSPPVIINPTINIGYKAILRNNSANFQYFENGSFQTKTQASTPIVSAQDLRISASGLSFFSTATQRQIILGSSLINADNLRSRYNTFYASRGLATY